MHLMKGHGKYQLLGRTRDDAAGEAFDKAARLLELGYPGGPAIQNAASNATGRYPLPRAWLPGTHDFSFSGLKTALYHLTHKEKLLGHPDRVANAAFSFQDAVVDVLVTKACRAADELGVTCIMLSGGVAANAVLRERLTRESPVKSFIPPLSLCTDNAAMVASCAYFTADQRSPSEPDLDVDPSLSLK